MTPVPLYQVKGICKSYGSVIALEDVNFHVGAGEVVALVGDNGAGKSTLVRILSGTNMPDKGEILLDGKRRRWKSPHEAMEAGVETLYQESSIAPDLDVAANIFLGREIARRGLMGKLGFLDEAAMRAKSQEALSRVSIQLEVDSQPVSRLSGGQRQAIAIGRAVAWASKVILLDEPTNHLGARQSIEVLNVIRRAKASGLGVVFISHTLPHVLEVSDRITVLRLGRVVADRPTVQFNADSLLKEITGLVEASSSSSL